MGDELLSLEGVGDELLSVEGVGGELLSLEGVGDKLLSLGGVVIFLEIANKLISLEEPADEVFLCENSLFGRS